MQELDTTPNQFDPSQHLSLVSGKQYLEVKYRIMWFRSEYPEGRIETEIHSYSKTEAVLKASVTAIRDGVVLGFASDYGSETPEDFGDYLEKASTKAIGRALATLGYGTQFCADHDFGAAQGRVVDSPVASRQGNAPTPIQQQRPAPQQNNQQWTNRNPPSDKQIGMMNKLIAEKGLEGDEINELAEKSSNGYAKTFTAMSKQDASKFIDALMSGGSASTQQQQGGYPNTREEAASGDPNAATTPQKNLIARLAREHNVSEGWKNAYCEENFGVSWEDLSKDDAKQMIEWLKNPEFSPI